MIISGLLDFDNSLNRVSPGDSRRHEPTQYVIVTGEPAAHVVEMASKKEI
jgi:hypothetical protein